VIATLLSIGLSVLVGLTVKAYALPIVKHLVAIRKWVYAVLGSEEGRAHGEEMLANLGDEIEYYRSQGDSSDAIAFKVFLRLVTGLPDDIVRCAPFVSALLAGRMARWSDTLRHYRVPTAMVAGVATLGLVNYSLLSSSNSQGPATWLFANAVVVGFAALLWKPGSPKASRVVNSLMFMAVAGAVALVLWMTVQYRAYEIVTFRIFMLAFVAMFPAIVVVDKPWRKRLFKGKTWLIVVCWAPVLAGALAGTWLMVHSVNPLLEVWALMALSAVGLLILFGGSGLAAYAICLAAVRGSAGGLQLLASGIRRLR